MRTKKDRALLQQLTQLVNDAEGTVEATVEALLVIAAGLAVKHDTHETCDDFRAAAHEAYHAAASHKERRRSLIAQTEPDRAN